MVVKRGVTGVMVALAGIGVVAGSWAAPERRPGVPRIVAAAMLDADRDARADGVRLTYSTLVRHPADRDGRYPFAITGYRIRSAGTASGRTLVILLVEQAKPDPAARPVIRYRQTRAKPVVSRVGAQAMVQVFRRVRAHFRTPPPLTTVSPGTGTTTQPTTTTSAPAAQPTPGDADDDGYPDDKDCAPRDARINPGAVDVPDLEFVDSNCDGIDGTVKDAVFASPNGADTNPGTREKPKRQIQAAVAAVAAGNGKYVLAAAGVYSHITGVSGMRVYGGYEANTWSRKNDRVTSIAGVSEGVLADDARDVWLQLLSISGVGANPGDNAYGIRAINSSSVFLQRVDISAGNGQPGASGIDGAAGRTGGGGMPGDRGACDHNVHAEGGAGGESPVSRDGGKGGNGRYGARGEDGQTGIVGTPGGNGGGSGPGAGPGIPGGPYPGEHGQKGTNGEAGQRGAGGTNTTALALATAWQGRGGVDGVYGAPGNGGGGGGAGGGQTGYLVLDGTGNAGGGGGGGGEGGRGGAGGRAGGGSFGVWLYDSVLVAEKSIINAGNGGSGGRGGNGGSGGDGGKGGYGVIYCGGELGFAGDGGHGGTGGQGGGGGGGAGGPSVGIFKLGGAPTRVTLVDTRVTAGRAGLGGASGLGGIPGAGAEPGLAQAVYP